MKNSGKRSQPEHRRRLAKILQEHRILVCQICMAVGGYNVFGTMGVWVNMHYEYVDFLPVFSSLEGVFRFFSGLLLIGFGWHFYALFKADQVDRDKIAKRQKMASSGTLKGMGEIHLN
jgi:hypothetical protein